MPTLEGRIRELKKELARAEAELVAENAKPPEIRLADLIHKITCNGNHVDYCGWEYEGMEDYTKPRSTRNAYYVRAVKILDGEDIDTVVRIISKFSDTR